MKTPTVTLNKSLLPLFTTTCFFLSRIEKWIFRNSDSNRHCIMANKFTLQQTIEFGWNEYVVKLLKLGDIELKAGVSIKIYLYELLNVLISWTYLFVEKHINDWIPATRAKNSIQKNALDIKKWQYDIKNKLINSK